MESTYVALCCFMLLIAANTLNASNLAQLLESEDEYVDEELLLDGTWGNFDGVPNPEYLKKKTAGAEVEKEEDGQAATDSASGDAAGGDDKDAAAVSDDKAATAVSGDISEDEGSEEKQLARLHFFRSKVHAKDVNRLVVASFVSRYLSKPRLHARHVVIACS